MTVRRGEHGERRCAIEQKLDSGSAALATFLRSLTIGPRLDDKWYVASKVRQLGIGAIGDRGPDCTKSVWLDWFGICPQLIEHGDCIGWTKITR